MTKVGSGVTPRGGQAAYLSSGIPLIRSQNVHLNRFEPKGLAFISEAQDKEMSGSRVEPNDVLLNITGASIGRVCVVPSDICPANVNQHVSIIRSDGSFEPEFLSFYLSQPAFQEFIMGNQAGATRQALTKSMIEAFEIALPVVEKQSAVVTRLKMQMKSALAVRESLIGQLNEIDKLPAALLRQAFTGKI